MACSFSRAGPCYAGELSSEPPLRWAASVRISSRIVAAPRVSGGAPSGTTTRRSQAPSPPGIVGRRQDAAGEDCPDAGFRCAPARSGLTHRSGLPTRRAIVRSVPPRFLPRGSPSAAACPAGPPKILGESMESRLS